MQPRSHHHYWTRDEILDRVRDFARQHGRPPGQNEFNALPGYPSSETVRRQFGSWNAGLVEAGLPTFEPEKVTTEQIVAAIRRWNEKHGQPPSWMDWRTGGPDHPTSGTVGGVFRSFNDAVEAAGLTPRFPAHYTRRSARSRNLRHERSPNSRLGSRRRARVDPEAANGAITGAAREDSSRRDEHEHGTGDQPA